MSRPISPGGAFDDFEVPPLPTLADYIREIGDARYLTGSAGEFTQEGTGAVERLVVDKLKEAVSVADFRAVIDADDLNSFTRAVATGRPVDVPYRSAPYQFSAYLNLSSGACIRGTGRGDKRPTIKLTGNAAVTRVFRLQSVSNVVIENLIVDGDKAVNTNGFFIFSITACSGVEVRNVKIINPRQGITITTSTFCKVMDCEILNSGGSGIQLDGSSDNIIDNCYLQGQAGFGVFLTNASHRNTITRCKTTQSGLELVGLRYDCTYNKITLNHAQGTGDNGISVTGKWNTVANNHCIANYHAGIWLYGYGNTCTGNICKNNNQRKLTDGTAYAGIQLESGFGGVSHWNSVSGNYCADDQETPTQAAGIWVRGAYYGQWGAAKTITTGLGTAYWINGSNIYYTAAAVGSVTGTTPPTHTSGTVSDGAVNWQFIDSFETSSACRNNFLASNTVEPHTGSSEVLDEVQGQNNIVQRVIMTMPGWRNVNGDLVAQGAAHNIRRTAQTWASGQAITFGSTRIVATKVYRCVNVGGTTSGTAPSHTSGTVTGADGVAWRYVYDDLVSASLINIEIDNDSTKFRHRVAHEVAQTGAYIYEFAGTGSPEGVVTAPVGSTYRRSDGGAGTCFYIKESGSGATGWTAK